MQEITLAFIATLPGLVLALGGLLTVLSKIRQVHTLVNSRTDQLVQKVAFLERRVRALHSQMGHDPEEG